MKLFPQEDVTVWAERYEIPLGIERPCLGCGKVQRAEIPFAQKSWRGLIAAEHGCGERYRLRVMQPPAQAEREENRRFARELVTDLKES